MKTYAIFGELQEVVDAYNQPIQLLDGLPFKQKDEIKTIEYYTNSKYLNSKGGVNKDELGREIPFMNIVNGMCDVENAAKEYDTKDIQASSDDSEHYVESFLLSKDIYEWMKEVNYAKAINERIDQHSRYGSVLVKKCIEEDEGEKQLYVRMPEWKNVINDQIDLVNGVIIEEHWMLPSDLKKKDDVWENIDEAMKLAIKDGKGYSSKRVHVFEVRGYFPRRCIRELEGGLTGRPKKDDYDYSYQLYYIAGEIGGNMVPLYWEDDTEKVYKYLARKKRSGRAFGVGVVKEGEEAQVWTNDAIQKKHRAMEISSKVVGQSATKNLKGRNLMVEVDDGQILETEENRPITTVQMVPASGFQVFDNLVTQWFQQFERTGSFYTAQRGEESNSGTPFRLQALTLQQSNSVFSRLKEDLGILETEIFTDWVMPFLAKRLNQEHILSHEFSPEELKMIDDSFSKHEANRMAKEKILSGQIVTQEDYDAWIEANKELLQRTRNQRFIKVPKDYYKSFKAKITVNVTGEQYNKAAVMESLFNIMSIYSKAPQLAQDPVLTKLFLRIVELSGAGISAASLMAAIQEQSKIREEQMQQMTPTQPQTPQMSLQANPLADVPTTA